MRRRRVAVLSLAVVLVLAWGSEAFAQRPVQPPPGPDEPGGERPIPPPLQGQTGLIPLGPRATGGPDAFGYTWDDSEPFSWIDATAGTDLTLSMSNPAVMVLLPFPIKHYEMTHTSIYATRCGYTSFTNPGTYIDCWPSGIPSSGTPNGVVAPYWSYMRINDGVYPGRAYMLSGGTEPNRWVAFEWHDMRDEASPDTSSYTFETVFHENGDIVFQYHTMLYGANWYTDAAGIEDIEGLDGLSSAYGQQLPSSYAVRYTRPAPAARLRLNGRAYLGGFTPAAGAVSVPLSLRNTGDLGTDVYDMSGSGLPMSFVASDGTTPLVDTDGDTLADSGPVAQATNFDFFAQGQVPADAGYGSSYESGIEVASSLDVSVTAGRTLQLAVPARAAQAFRSDADGAMSLRLLGPEGETVQKVTDDWYDGWDLAVTETASGGYLYAWSKYYGGNGRYEIEYTLLDHAGMVVSGPVRLTDDTASPYRTYDYGAAVSTSAGGETVIAWYRYEYDTVNYFYRYNVMAAGVSATGDLAWGPVNVTNNDVWSPNSWYHTFYDVDVKATTDNRLVLTWYEQLYDAGWHSNVWAASLGQGGQFVTAPTMIDGEAWYPALAALSGGRVLLTTQKYGSNYQVSFTVLDSSLSIVAGPSAVLGNTYGADAVQSSEGNIAIAWVDGNNLIYMLLGPSYTVVQPPTTVPNAAGIASGGGISLTADARGNFIITWGETGGGYGGGASGSAFYYALISPTGQLLAAPMVYSSGSSSYYWGDGTTFRRRFLDVGVYAPLAGYIERLADAAITGGCDAAGNYCPSNSVTRAQMAMFIARAHAGADDLVPASGTIPGGGAYDCSAGGTSLFTDVGVGEIFCRHVHYIAAQGVTLGCTATEYCPAPAVIRSQMAMFLARSMTGSDASVPVSGTVPGKGAYNCVDGGASVFADITPTSVMCRHVHYLAAAGVTSGCTATEYCPSTPTMRSQMAKFLVNAFELP